MRQVHDCSAIKQTNAPYTTLWFSAEQKAAAQRGFFTVGPRHDLLLFCFALKRGGMQRSFFFWSFFGLVFAMLMNG